MIFLDDVSNQVGKVALCSELIRIFREGRTISDLPARGKSRETLYG